MMFANRLRLSVLTTAGLALLLGSAFSQSPAILPLPAQGGTRGPSALLFRADGKQLWVAEQDENDIAVLDSVSGRPVAHIPSGGEQPVALALSPDSRTLVVANTFSGSVGIVDVEKQTLRATIPLLGEPAGVAVTADGRAWVSVSQLDQIAVIDIAQGKILQRIGVGHGPRVLALTPDGKTLVCANSLGGSLSLIDTSTKRERRRIALPAINLRGMAFTADGAHIWVTGQQPHNELSTVRPETLWSNVLCEVRLGEEETRKPGDKDKPADGKGLERMLVLDRPEFGAADPCGIALNAKEETAFVALSGTHEIAVVPLNGNSGLRTTGSGQLREADRKVTPTEESAPGKKDDSKKEGDSKQAIIEGSAAKAKSIFKSDGGDIRPNLPIIMAGAETRRIAAGCNPRSLALRPHSGEIWVGNHLGNSLTILSVADAGVAGNKVTMNTPVAKFQPASTQPTTLSDAPRTRLIDLGSPTPSPNRRLKGRFFFASAHVSHGQFFSCESCHPNGGTDGLSWKFAHVKDGMDARNTKDLRGLLLLTAPYGWGGREEDFEVFVHDEVGGLLKTRKLQHPEVHALWDLVNETPLSPNPYRNADGTMTASALRGKGIFNGQGGCANCHIGNMAGGTKKRENIGTTPAEVTIDVPHLVGAYDSAPYLHDGRARTLEEIFTKYNPKHLHGNADSLTPEQLKDLLEYVREL